MTDEYRVFNWIDSNPNEAQAIAEGVIEANTGDLAAKLLDGIDENGVQRWAPLSSLSAEVYEAIAEKALSETAEAYEELLLAKVH